MASDVKRAYSPCPVVLLAFLTRLQESIAGCDPSRRANARRERVPARRLRIETPFGLHLCFNLWFHLPACWPADAPYPYQTVGPGPHEAGRDCDTNGGIAVLHDWLPVDRVPRRRSSSFPWTPSIHTGSSSHESSPWRGQESQFVGGSGQGQSRRFKSIIFVRIVISECGRRRWSNPTEQVLSWRSERSP
jgi:hypothetical protein